MSTFREPKNRQPWFVDWDGTRARTKRYSESLSETIDWTNALDSGETISSATWTADGPTISGASATTTTTTATVVGVGEAVIQVTTSASRILERRLRWIGIDRKVSDYA